MKKKRIIIIIFVLMLMSIVNNYYAGFMVNSYSNYFIKQLFWYSISFLVIYIIFKLNIEFIFKYSFYLYLFGNFLLMLTLMIGTYVNGAKGWLSLGIISIQPSEFMKIFLILYLRYYSLKYNLSDFKYILFTGIIIVIPSILTFLEPDTGAVLIYLIIWLVFLFLKRLNKWYYIVSVLGSFILIGVFLILYYKYQDNFISIFGTSFFYRMDRVNNFIHGEGYQLTEALKSTSNAGLFGIKNKLYFPESATDFALSLFISNFGIIGLLFLLVIYNLFFYELLNFNQDKYLLYPIVFILLFQYISNILMNVGLFPIIGITLPFISYGGSSLLSFMILIGLLIKEKVSLDTYL